ncbi:TPA: ribonuclease HI [Escherichia coli]|nr:ribonuclease HI [Escherichia coli]
MVNSSKKNKRNSVKESTTRFDPNLKTITIYTDGSCLKNPGGAGGYGVLMQYQDTERVFSDGFFSTTNNRMEMMAALVGLERLKYPCNVIIFTDSQYLKNGMTSWIKGWKRKNWMKSKNAKVKNADLWQRLDHEASKHNVRWCWVKGHSGQRENEICDLLAREAALQARKSPEKVDVGYAL